MPGRQEPSSCALAARIVNNVFHMKHNIKNIKQDGLRRQTVNPYAFAGKVVCNVEL